jgi:transposase, IS30 family
MTYKHLSLEERHYIEVSLKNEESHSTIAESLNRSQCSITREITRNTGLRGYRHKQAHKMAKERHQLKQKTVKLTDSVKNTINDLIRKDWSPEQVCGWLKKENNVSLHHETIYQYVLADKISGGQLYLHLRHQKKTYRKRYGSSNKRTKNGIIDRVDIDERPDIVNNRERIGDWEADTIIGKNHRGAIVTLDERKSKLRLAMPTGTKAARSVTDAIKLLFTPIQAFIKTVTFDNGKEFAYHKEIASTLSCNTYFAKPYHSWERGQNENANGLLRQYFPKSMELVDATKKDVFDAVHKLNSRPRKCLGYDTPYEAFEKLTGIDMELEYQCMEM